jgi:hypothetical protein
MYRLLFLLLFVALSSVAPAQSISGKWESTQLQISMSGQVVSLKIRKGDFRYSTWEFKPKGVLVMTTGKNSSSVPYSYRNDTIFILAANGRVNAVPVLDLSYTMLKIRHAIPDSNMVGLFRRLW